MSEFLGSRISLISKSDIRYVGTLHEIDSDASTVSLENVRSFGTEGRRGRPEEEISASDQVYEYIVFRGSDVKDLRIEEHPTIKENKPPAMPDDPAIVGVRARPTGQEQNAPPPPPPNVAGMPQHPYPPTHFYGGPPPPAAWGRGAPMPGPEFGNMPYPPPPGWFPPGQGFSHDGPVGPGLWNSGPFPPRPGGPPGPPVPETQRIAPEAPPPGPAQSSKPAPIGPGADKAKPAPAAHMPLTEPQSVPQASRQPANAPTVPGESKAPAEDTGAAATKAPQSGDASKALSGAARNSRVTPVMPLSGSAAKTFQPPVAEVKAAQSTTKIATTSGPSSVQDATDAARAAVAMAMAQLGGGAGATVGAGPLDNLTSKVNEMRIQAGRGGSTTLRPRGRGGAARPPRVTVPDADFDFAQANAKFHKENFVKETIAGSPSAETPNGSIANGAASSPAPAPSASEPAAYNKSRSFFDNISSEARERAENNGQKPGGREWRGEEQRRNMETFGQGSVDGGYRNYRGRGRGRGRGGGGRGFGRGGRGGGPRPQYQSTAATQ